MDRFATEINQLWRRYWTTITLFAVLLAFSRVAPRLPRDATPAQWSGFAAETLLAVILAFALAMLLHYVVRAAYRRLVNRHAQ